MICRGIIEEIIDRYQVRVRIPIIHQIENTAQFILDADLPVASICTSPNTHLNISVGDVVIVGFENQDLGRPIILGYLYTGEFSTTAASQSFNSISILGSAKLPADTSVGNITSSELNQLSGLRGNVQHQLDAATTAIDQLEKINPYLLNSINSLNQRLFEFSLDINKNEYACINLKESAYDIVIPEKVANRPVTQIAQEAFKDSNIVTAALPKTIQHIDKQAFENCLMLEKIDVYSDYINVDYDIFKGCSDQIYNKYSGSSYVGDNRNPYKILIYAPKRDSTSYSIHPDTLIIAGCAFYTSYLTSITLPGKLKVISTSAFSQCINLKTIVIPASVKFIGDYAFYNCNSLSTIYYRGSSEEWDNIEKSSGWNSNMNQACTIICNYK